MGFWGVEVKPKKKVDPFASVSARGRLRITQAILGPGVSSQKAILQCFTDPKHSIYLCVLSPDKTDSCSLDLEFDVEDKVAFSVIGNRSIHLSGYFLTDDGESDGDDCEIGCCAEDEADSDSWDLSEEYDSEEEYDDFSEESDYEILPSPTAKSGVVIEEIVDDEKPAFENGKQEQKDESQGRMVVKSIAADPNLGSEDEDGYPLSVLQGKTKETEAVQLTDILMIEETMEGKDEGDNANNRKRDLKSVEQDEKPDKKKKRKKEKGNNKEKNGDTVDGGSKPDEVKKSGVREVALVGKEDEKSHDSEPKAEKKNKKKNKKKAQDSASAAAAVNKDQPVVDRLDRPSETKPSQVRTFPNGLVIEELAMGEPDGKKAGPGKQVFVRYIGKLQKNGKIFDSNIRQAPFKFRLGIGHVIKGWDVGVNGMRIGDKRRLTIPPSMGYGAKGAGGKIPPNSWLVFDVELVDVR